MGLIRAAAGAVGGTLGDAWLEAIESGPMTDKTVCKKGQILRPDDRRSSNRKATSNIISNGSRIVVQPNQFMMLIDGGKIVDYTAETGYYVVDNSSTPSLFNGQFGDSLRDSWNRFKFGGTPSQMQQVYFINLQEIKGIKFGTPNAVQYYDEFYQAELFLRAHGNYSIKVVDPLLFFAEAIPRGTEEVDIADINDQYLSEFLMAFQTSLNLLSQEGVRISTVTSQSMKLAKHMQDVLDEEWRANRGMVVQFVGVNSISYDDKSRELIDMRSQTSMLSDPNLRETYVQTSVARGIEAAGSNEGGAGNAFLGVGMGMMGAGNFMNQSSQTNMEMMRQQQAQQQGWGYPPQGQGYPPQGQGYPPQGQGYPPQGQGYPPQGQGYPPQGQGYPPQGQGYPPQGQQGQPYPPQGQQPPQGQPPQGQQPPQQSGEDGGGAAPTGNKFCMNCGFNFGGQNPKFCPNCGTPNKPLE
ncbi:MAG: virion core protein [Clostridiaceae bacterium]|nr:virion core protein [Clostridiaceae bacterium]